MSFFLLQIQDQTATISFFFKAFENVAFLKFFLSSFHPMFASIPAAMLQFPPGLKWTENLSFSLKFRLTSPFLPLSLEINLSLAALSRPGLPATTVPGSLLRKMLLTVPLFLWFNLTCLVVCFVAVWFGWLSVLVPWTGARKEDKAATIGNISLVGSDTQPGLGQNLTRLLNL